MSGYKDKVTPAIGMALQHIRLCAPDATVDAALEQAARDFRELAEQRVELLAALKRAHGQMVCLSHPDTRWEDALMTANRELIARCEAAQ
jgi:hypothetical protein